MEQRMVALRLRLVAVLAGLLLAACGTFADLDAVEFEGHTTGVDTGPVECAAGAPCAIAITSAPEARHTCALMADQTVRCWGSNRTLQIGDPARQAFQRTPQAVAGLATPRSFGAGRNHTCALTAQGEVVCWGANGAGEQGREGGASSVPMAVERLVDAPVDELVVGVGHSCVRQGGQVSCWGLNDHGQLGNAVGFSSALPLQVLLPAPAVRIWAGGLDTCAALDDGRLFCWGSNAYGLLTVDADEGICDAPCSPTPVEVTALGTPDDLVMGIDHACARIGAELRCWGDNSAGQLGAAASEGGANPEVVAGLGAVEAVAVGFGFTCAVVTGGEVWCWGLGDAGQGGDGTFRSQSTPTLVPSLQGATKIVAGDGHVCAVHGAGAVSCWGSSYRGQSGSPQANQGTPLALPLSGEATAIAAGEDHTCAATADGLTCWGEDASGQLGTGTALSHRAPFTVPGLTDVVQVEASSDATCARNGSGEVWCWGNNEDGQLGRGPADPSPTPGKVSLSAPAIDVRSGAQTFCARFEGGAVACWGGDQFGALGSGTGGGTNVPRPLLGVEDADALFGGLYTFCARRDNGEVLCWGNNEGGKLGLPADSGDCGGAPCVTSPTVVPELAGLTDYGSGAYHACARFDSGEVRCLGLNDVGQLGDGTFDAHGAPAPVAELDALSLSTGHDHTCAITRDGTVRCWGWGDLGRLGTAVPLPQCDGICASAPVPVAGLADAVAVRCGELHCCALRRHGAVQCWGDNAEGQLAQPEAVPSMDRPVDVAFE